MGWFTVWAYATGALMAAATALRMGDRAVEGARLKARTLWLLVALLMAFLCVNKQLDLQSLFTDIGRVAAKREGWYGQRRDVQAVFVFCVLGSAAGLVFWMTVKLRVFWSTHTLLLAGLIYTLTFIVVRTVSFHHIDRLLNTHLEGMKMNWLLELTGIALVTAAALLELATTRK
jgi:hypothetical protein